MKTNFTTRLCLVCIGTLSIGSLAAAAIQESDNPFGKNQAAKSLEPSQLSDTSAAATDDEKTHQHGTHDPFNDNSGDDPFGTNTDSASSQYFASETENNRNCEKKLNLTYDLPEVVGMPMSEFIRVISEHYKIPTYIDSNALEDEGLDIDQEVNWNLPNVRLRTALTMILDQQNLTFYIKDGILVITTQIEVEDRQTLKVYDCQKILEKSDLSRELQGKELVTLLTTTVDPLSWEVNGGPVGATLTQFQNKLVVRNTEAVHHDLQLLLEELAR